MAEMGAGLQRDIGGGAARRLARLIQRPAFGVGAATRLGPAAPHYAAPAGFKTIGSACHDHTANRRVRPCVAQAPRRKGEGCAHMVGIAHSSAVPVAGRSSETNLSKSSAAWKFL